MTLLQHIAAANADGDRPTAQDLSDALDLPMGAVYGALYNLRRDGLIRTANGRGHPRRYRLAKPPTAAGKMRLRMALLEEPS